MELFEIELIICMKMDVGLNNLQRLICHKTETTVKPLNCCSMWKYFELLFYVKVFWMIPLCKIIPNGCSTWKHDKWFYYVKSLQMAILYENMAKGIYNVKPLEWFLLCKKIANSYSIWKHCKWLYYVKALQMVSLCESTANGFTVLLSKSISNGYSR